MKKQIIILLITFNMASGFIMAQTPYDTYAPEQSRKEMLQLPKTNFSVFNDNAKDSVKYIKFDQNRLLLTIYNADNTIIKSIKINPLGSKFTSIDRFAEKYPWQSPYCYAANNPLRYIDVNGDSIGVNQ